jgi:hypothetical protein
LLPKTQKIAQDRDQSDFVHPESPDDLVSTPLDVRRHPSDSGAGLLLLQ